jgi:hypothetical protein
MDPLIQPGSQPPLERIENRPTFSHQVVILFNGNSIEGVANDVYDNAEKLQLGQGHTPLVVCRDADRIAPPEGLESTTVSKFEVKPATSYTVIANGGTAQQLVPIIMKLRDSGQLEAIFEVNRFRETNELQMKRLWPE